MAFQNKATVDGSKKAYQVNKQARAYTFKDYGFKETNVGNFQLVRPLDTNPQNKQSPKFKMTVSKDLKTLKMSITTSNGLTSLNIFKNAELDKEKQEQFEYIISDLIHCGCIEEA